MSNEQHELLNEAYENWLMNTKKRVDKETLEKFIQHTPNIHKEEFIGKIITNPDFAKQWGVTIYTVVEDGNTRIGINYNDKTIESYE